MSTLVQGIYKAKAIEASYQESSKSATPFLFVRFQVIEGEHKGSTCDYNGWVNTSDNMERTMKVMRTCGWQGNDATKLEELGAKEVQIDIELEEQEGYEPRLRVAWVNEPGSTAIGKAMSEEKVSGIAAKIAALAVARGFANGGLNGAKPTATGAPAPIVGGGPPV